MGKYDIFISYRRKDTDDKAELLQLLLINEGYKKEQISFDRENLSGKFDIELVNRVDECENFIVVIGENTFDEIDREAEEYMELANMDVESLNNRLSDYYVHKRVVDFMRLEIARAINKNKNIIPIVSQKIGSNNFFSIELPKDIMGIKRSNAIFYSTDTNKKFSDQVRKQLLQSLITRPRPIIRIVKMILRIILALIILVGVIYGYSRVIQYRDIKKAEDIIEYHNKHKGEAGAYHKLSEIFNDLKGKGYSEDDTIMIELKRCLDEY